MSEGGRELRCRAPVPAQQVQHEFPSGGLSPDLCTHSSLTRGSQARRPATCARTSCARHIRAPDPQLLLCGPDPSDATSYRPSHTRAPPNRRPAVPRSPAAAHRKPAAGTDPQHHALLLARGPRSPPFTTMTAAVMHQYQASAAGPAGFADPLDGGDDGDSDAPPLLLVTTVDIGNGEQGRIELRVGDHPVDVARAFCLRHGLPDSIVLPLAQHLEENLAENAAAAAAAGTPLPGYADSDGGQVRRVGCLGSAVSSWAESRG